MIEYSIGSEGSGSNQKDLLTFLTGWSEHGPWWATAIPREGGGTETATFTDLSKLAAWVADRNGRKNIYFSVNDLSANTRKKASKDEVTRIRGLHVDVDPRPVEGGADGKAPRELAAHFNAERARIRAMADDWLRDGKKLPFPQPTAIIDSGGGFQFFWRFENDEKVSPEQAETLNRMISIAMGGDNTHDVSCIMRLAGDHQPCQQEETAARTLRCSGPAGCLRLHKALSCNRLPRAAQGDGVCGWWSLGSQPACRPA